MGKAQKSNKVTLEDLTALRTELENAAAAKQIELAEQTYSVNFEETGNITKVLNHLNKDVSWSSKNAALLVNLHDNLKNEKTRLTIESNLAKNEKRTLSAEEAATVQLKQIDLNTLYQSLLAIQSTGVESARTYVRLLTNIGGQITEAMKTMAEANKQIQSLHVELAEIDAKITEQETPQTVATDETVEQI